MLNKLPVEGPLKFRIIFSNFLSSSTQDTYHCPDGWVLQEDGRACRCFLFSGYERVTRSDADVLCSFHDAAWVAEIDYPGKCVDVVSKS